MVRQVVCLTPVILFALVGCAPTFGPRAENGIVFYAPGAGNFDAGDAGIREGLERAGFDGEVASVLWTVSFNPAIDQAIKINARFGGDELAKRVVAFKDKYPDASVNLVGLSAGTGVVLFACEALPEGYSVDNVILLASSVSSDYDVSKALRRIDGKIYNIYSSRDVVLSQLMKPFGTIDGRWGVEGAGAVGLSPPRGRDRVVNIAWRREFQRWGYHGDHTGPTSAGFVRNYLSQFILEGDPPRPTADAKPRVTASLAGTRGQRPTP